MGSCGWAGHADGQLRPRRAGRWGGAASNRGGEPCAELACPSPAAAPRLFPPSCSSSRAVLDRSAKARARPPAAPMPNQAAISAGTFSAACGSHRVSEGSILVFPASCVQICAQLSWAPTCVRAPSIRARRVDFSPSQVRPVAAAGGAATVGGDCSARALSHEVSEGSNVAYSARCVWACARLCAPSLRARVAST